MVKSKSRKTSNSKKLSKGQKLFNSGLSKSENLSKFKKMSKSGNLPKFATKEVGLSWLTPDARMTSYHLWLAFTKSFILYYFDLKGHI